MPKKARKSTSKPENYNDISPYVFITKYLIPTTKPDAKALVCIKPNNPKNKDPWTPSIVTDSLIFPPDANLYISISSCYKLDDPTSKFHDQYRNKLNCAAQTHMFMLDDLGDSSTPEQPNYEKLPLKPTWIIETSPHNYQALYVLSEPLDNIALANQITKQLPGQVRSDKASVNAVRWARLPGGINNKPEYGDTPFRTRIEVANPEATYHTSQIIDGFNLELDTPERIQMDTSAVSKINIIPMEGWARHMSAICAMDPECDYDTWFKVATVLHPWGEQGLQTFIAWSQASTKHNPTEQEIISKFHDVDYDIQNTKGHTNIVSWPWLEARARENGWDYDTYSRDLVKELVKQVADTEDMETLELLSMPIYDAFLSAPDYNFVIASFQQKAAEFGETISMGEIKALIRNPKKIDPSSDCWTYPLTDTGNLERFHALYNEEYFFIPELSKHFEWEDDKWVTDSTSQLCALNTLKRIKKMERNPLNEIQLKALNKWQNICESYGRISALTTLIRKDRRLDKSLKEFNVNPKLMGTESRIFNIDTRVTSDNQPEHLINLKSRFAYDEDATCPRWEEFISEITQGDKGIMKFLQLIAGYSLLGGNPEQMFIVLNGNGSNGKSTFISTLEYIMGDYATTTNPTTLTKPTYGRSAGAAAPDLLRLFQKRLVLCNEWEDNTYLNESLIKSLTGGSDPVSVRGLYANTYLSYVPEYLIMLATNHIPKIAGMDDGIWRRLIIIPFNVNFDAPENKKLKDDQLGNHFKHTEASGIFKWMVDGYHMSLQDKVTNQVPQVMLDLKEEYKQEMDTVGQFLMECCVLHEYKTKVASSDLYQAYDDWCKKNGNHPKAARTFSRTIVERGHIRARIGKINGFKEIRLLTLSELADQNRALNANDEDSHQAATTRLN